jgi:branched-chain amino acid aminotransferase
VIRVSIDGELVPAEQATVSVFDRGLLYGDGCFEVLRTWGAATPDLDAHLDRLYATAQFLTLAAIERDQLRASVLATVAAAGTGDHRIRIVLTRGFGALTARFAELGRGRAIVIVERLPPRPTELSLATVDWPIPRHGEGKKTLAYLDPLIARELARAAGADEALRLDHLGNVVEGATCNVFAVVGGTVVTPPTEFGALPGVTRQRVLECCETSAIAAAVEPLSIDAVRGAAEVFVTSSLRGVVPVTRLDGVPRPAGPLTTKVARAYVEVMRRASTVI